LLVLLESPDHPLAAARATAGAADRFRIVSANLWNGRARPDAFAALLAELDADAAALQELAPCQAEAIARILPHGKLCPATNYMGMGIALRQPAPIRRLALPHRDAHIAEVRLAAAGGRAVVTELINVHVRAPHSPPSPAALRHRRGQWRGMRGHLLASPDLPRVVIGDFNATPLWPIYRRMSAHLRDAALIAARRNGGRTYRTWRPRPGLPRLLRIDQAFVSGVEVVDFRVLEIAGGDHFALVVDVRAAAANAPAPA
jgi:endonuclease/exonuclease/phosphatase (EEP) superfamily protein YafD